MIDKRKMSKAIPPTPTAIAVGPFSVRATEVLLYIAFASAVGICPCIKSEKNLSKIRLNEIFPNL